MKRKIAAIVAADVAGYSRLVEQNEEDTLRRFIAASHVFKILVAEHYGRIFNTAGDAILAEFSSPVEAVRCAAGIQTRMRDLNDSQPKDRQLLFRIGISIGDVIEHETDLLGDGVNIAARLQTLASPGGLSISHWVHEQIAGKIELEFRDAGWHSVRNIAKPVHVFLADIGYGGKPFEPDLPIKSGSAKRAISNPIILSLVAGAIAITATVLVWQRAAPTPSTTAVPAEPAKPISPPAIERAAVPAPASPPPPTAPATAPLAPAATAPLIKETALPREQIPVATPPEPPPQPPQAKLPIVPQPSLPPTAAAPKNAGRTMAQCAEIRERAQLGDISNDDRLLLRTDCK